MVEARAVNARLWQRTSTDTVLLDGFHALKHALRFGAEVRLAITNDKDGALALSGELAEDLRSRLSTLLVEVSDQVFRELVPRSHPTGVAALATRPEASTILGVLNRTPRTAPIVVLENPRNLGNIGAVIRLAAGFGVTGVVTTGDADPWHTNVVRGSAGLHFATAIERLNVTDLPAGPLYVMDPEGADIRSMIIPNTALIAFGSERHGISSTLRDRAAQLVAVPMRPHVSSFNLATTVGMALYHWSLLSDAAPSQANVAPLR